MGFMGLKGSSREGFELRPTDWELCFRAYKVLGGIPDFSDKLEPLKSWCSLSFGCRDLEAIKP